ncbi:MAG: type II toxin-antitoxin system PemK/MazF family toxin [Rhizomicrobium sp.]
MWLEFSPHRGHEQAGRRPAIVLTPRAFHERSTMMVVCPITTRERGWPTEVKLPPDSPVSGVILIDQIRSLDRTARHLKIAGATSQDVLDAIGARLAPFLSL